MVNRRLVGCIALGLAVIVMGTACKGSGPDAATDALSTLTALKTNVDTGRGTGAFARGHTGDKLAPGDRLRTDTTGHAELNWQDGSLTRLGPATTLRISPLAKIEGPDIKLQLDVGETWNRVERITGSGGYEVETPVGTAAVRGTQFVVACAADASCTFTVLDGTVVVTTKTGEQITLTAGQTLTLTNTGGTFTPTTPGIDTLRADPFIAQNLRLDALPSGQRAAAFTGATTTSTASGNAGTTFLDDEQGDGFGGPDFRRLSWTDTPEEIIYRVEFWHFLGGLPTWRLEFRIGSILEDSGIETDPFSYGFTEDERLVQQKCDGYAGTALVTREPTGSTTSTAANSLAFRYARTALALCGLDGPSYKFGVYASGDAASADGDGVPYGINISDGRDFYAVHTLATTATGSAGRIETGVGES